MIDNQDISKLSLNALRDRLTILPQEAQLFSGTVRDNLDPFNQHEDYDVWEALRQCGLASKLGSQAGSRAPSRVASRRDLSKGAAASLASTLNLRNIQAAEKEERRRNGDLQAGEEEDSLTVLGGLQAKAVGNDLRTDEEEDSEIGGSRVGTIAEERVTIRSLEEKVAVGGKNFSRS